MSMCPCGCGKTREQAIRSMMRGPMALNYDQADAMLDDRFPPESTEKGSTEDDGTP